MEESKVYNLDGFEATAFLPPNAKIQEPKPSKCCGPCCGKKCCCCITSWKCCGIVTGITLLIIGLLLGMAAWSFHKRIQQAAAKSKEMQKGASEWENRLSSDTVNLSDQDLITGKYELVSYTEGYSKYLEAVGVPSFVIPLITSASETFIVTKNDTHIKFGTHKGGEFRENDFKFGEITPLAPKRSNMIIHVNCTNPSLNFILCESEERTNAWKFSVTYRFSTSGIINSRNFTTKNIEFKKFYQREGEVLNNIETDQNSVVTIPTEPPSTKDPFDDFDDDDF